MTDQEKRIAEFVKAFRVEPGSKVTLAKDFDPGYKADFMTKKDGVELLERGVGLLAEYQARLAAQDTYGVLVCLQALDAGGKDGTIRHVMSGVNPQGVSVNSFKVPSDEELQPRLPLALREASARPRRDRHLQPLALRGGAGRPRPPRDPRPAAASRRVQGQARLGAPLRGDQRLGALPLRQRLPGRQALPQPLEGGAADAVPEAARPPGEELEVLLARRRASASTGTTTSRRSRRCSRTRARSGRRGT